MMASSFRGVLLGSLMAVASAGPKTILTPPGAVGLGNNPSNVAAGELPVPTPAQARYQDTDFVALIHFNMGTFAHNGDPCCDASNWDVKAPYATGKTSDPATFNPAKLNTTQWFDSINALGANIAVLTSKHGCGFGLWPTKTVLPDGSPYGYDVGAKNAAKLPVPNNDVLGAFVESAKANGVGYGFYYSIMKSFYLCHSFTGANSCMETILPGQRNYSLADYTHIQVQMVKEIWQNYGNLTEIWVDSGTDGLDGLMAQLQPEAANGPRTNPVTWCGTESGHPSIDPGPGPYGGDIWNLAGGHWGSPNGTTWLPRMCDPQLFQEHVWFWEPGLHVRTLEMMIPIYHDIVGRGMTMEIAFSIDRDGLVQDTHAAQYKALGDWVRQCYGTPLATTSGGYTNEFFLKLPKGVSFDRVMLQEKTVQGQRVRRWAVESSTDGSTWSPLFSGQAIGIKAIKLLNSTGPWFNTTRTVTTTAPTTLRLQIHEAVAPPIIKTFAVFAPCPSA